MGCLYCRKKIGTLRRLRDRHFCCTDHRQKFGSKSARIIRETEDLYGFDEASVPTWRAVTLPRPEDKHERKAGMGATIFFGAAIAVVLLAVSQMPTNSPAPRPSRLCRIIRTTPEAAAWDRAISQSHSEPDLGNLARGFPFRFLKLGWPQIGWFRLGHAGRRQVRPTSLRLWKPSTSLSNYELEFPGQINRKSMDWAFRAADLHNYYATKLVITHPGPCPTRGWFASSSWMAASANAWSCRCRLHSIRAWITVCA